MRFLFPPGRGDLALIAPEMLLLAGALVLVLLEAVRSRRAVPVGGVALAAQVLAIGALAWPIAALAAHQAALPLPFLARTDASGAPAPLLGFHGNVVLDGFAVSMKVAVLFGGMLATLISLRYAERFRRPGEFHALQLAATAAAAMLPGSADLLMTFVCLQLLGLCTYGLVGYLKHQPTASGVAMGYMLAGAACAAAALYGISLLYGLTGATGLYAVKDSPTLRDGVETALVRQGGQGVVMAAMALLGLGFGHQLGLAPFHLWGPRLTDAAPTPVGAWHVAVVQVGVAAALLRVLVVGFRAEFWAPSLAVLAALTMTCGSLAALHQTNLKRALGSLAVAQTAAALVVLCALGRAGGVDPRGEASVWQHVGLGIALFAGGVTVIGAFAVVSAVTRRTQGHELAGYAGLSRRAPWLAGLMTLFLCSLMGLPPTAGFWGKYVIVAAALEAGLYWVAVVVLLNAVLAALYCLRVIRVIYSAPAGEGRPVPVSGDLRLALTLAAVATGAAFLIFGPFLQLIGGR